ncbi:MAG TPA: PhzF family phenazine biosynthesis protein [Candidatus Saccharimonadales bacterium]|nr:PhzF family phenazine biosynthesis protein [Candidatus Saccharimonadales bacterium]
MNNSHRYLTMDVFSERIFEGNQLAVFPDAAGIADITMQHIATELNLAETAFIAPATRPDCAVSVRIFTPKRELSFAGHPTIGTSFVVLKEFVPKDTSEFILEEKIGPVRIRVEPGIRPLIWLATPPITFGRLYDPDDCAKALGLNASDLLEASPQVVSAGNQTLIIPVRDKEHVDQASLESSGLSLLKKKDEPPLLVMVFTPTPEGAYSRVFGPEYGVREDPATGSATGPLAAFMIENGLISGAAGTRFVSEQGVKMGRRSILHVRLNGEKGVDGIEIGGYVSPVAEATMTLHA